MVSQARIDATTKYIKNHMRQFVVRCNNVKDADVIEYLENCGNITETVKRLVREEIDKKSNKTLA